MATFKHRLIGAGSKSFSATGLHRLAAPLTRGRGAILTFHHVRPWQAKDFAPNRLLAITPEHLDAVLRHVARAGYRVIPLADVVPRLRDGSDDRFVALTFDDGYRDTLVHALPVLERHAAPFTVYVTAGFADRTARLWWLELETVVGAKQRIETTVDDRSFSLPSRTPAEKARCFTTLARRLARGSSPAVAGVLADLGCSRLAAHDLVAELCLSWDEIDRLAAHPLATIGNHTLTHPSLAALDPSTLAREMTGASEAIEARLGRPVRHLAYPYGGSPAAGAREFAAAKALGFETAVTTRPGVLFPAHAAHATALPRLSVNGLWPTLDAFDVLLSGVPFALWNRAGASWPSDQRPAE